MATIAFLEPYLRGDAAVAAPASHADVVPVLFMSLLRKIEQARRAQDNDRPVEKGFYLGRATAIVDALRDALDLGEGGQLATDLDRIYGHIDLCLQISVGEAAVDPLDLARQAIRQLFTCWPAGQTGPLGTAGTA
jgi:flagellar protein FliS